MLAAMISARRILLLVLATSVGIIGGAWIFQYAVGLQPCELCYLERWPYYVSIVLAILLLASGARGAIWWIGLLALIFLGSTGLGAYHVGVEQHWITGPTACTGGGSGAKSAEELMKFLQTQQSVRCDEVQWSLLGISLAGWNALTSLGLLVATAFGFVYLRKAPAP